MFGKRWDNPYPHVKYTKRGDPFVDVDEVLTSKKGRRLTERMKLIEKIIDRNSNGNKSSNEQP